jgi:hypothetical protein
MSKQDRILKRISKALDRAIKTQTPTHLCPWCVRWSNAYKRELDWQAHNWR